MVFRKLNSALDALSYYARKGGDTKVPKGYIRNATEAWLEK